MAEHPHVTCQQVVELVTDYLEHALPPDEASLFEQHVNFCDGCDWYLEQMRATIASVGRITEEDVPVETRDKLLSAFREWKR
jgi:anti-sigma factor RsiW